MIGCKFCILYGERGLFEHKSKEIECGKRERGNPRMPFEKLSAPLSNRKPFGIP